MKNFLNTTYIALAALFVTIATHLSKLFIGSTISPLKNSIDKLEAQMSELSKSMIALEVELAKLQGREENE